MSKLMTVLGIILLAIGVAFALLGYFNPTRLQLLTMTMETPALLIVGGILAIGLGGVIAALDRGGRVASAEMELPKISDLEPAPIVPPIIIMETPAAIVAATPEIIPEVPVEQPQASRIRFPGFGRKLGATAVTVGAAEVVADATSAIVKPATSSVQDTIAALEQAKTDINNALGGVASVTTPAPAIVEEVVEPDEDVADAVEGELYVIEERMIRGRPARVLSDNTVEAETDEGWMRFENLEHLNEYLDAAGDDA